MGERKGHSSDTAPHVEHLVVWTELAILDEITKMFLPNSGKPSVADKAPQSVRGKIETSGCIDQVENGSLGVSKNPAHRRGQQALQR